MSKISLAFLAILLCFLKYFDNASAFSCFLSRSVALNSIRDKKNTILLSCRVAQLKVESSPREVARDGRVKRVDNLFTIAKTRQLLATVFFASSLCFATAAFVPAAFADQDGASKAENAKITTGGASTLQSGRTISITRGVNLDRSDFSNQNLKGVAFQQSVVRDAKFTNSNLVGSSFFDATLDGSDFENADLSQCNLEMAQLKRANFKNAIMRDMYISGSTLVTGIKDIEGTDWTDSYLRRDQKEYLCNHPTAKGINPVTGVSTRESLLCVD